MGNTASSAGAYGGGAATTLTEGGESIGRNLTGGEVGATVGTAGGMILALPGALVAGAAGAVYGALGNSTEAWGAIPDALRWESPSERAVLSADKLTFTRGDMESGYRVGGDQIVAATTPLMTSGRHCVRVNLNGPNGNSMHIGLMDAAETLTKSSGGEGVGIYVFSGTWHKFSSPYARSEEKCNVSFGFFGGKECGVELNNMVFEAIVDMDNRTFRCSLNGGASVLAWENIPASVRLWVSLSHNEKAASSAQLASYHGPLSQTVAITVHWTWKDAETVLISCVALDGKELAAISATSVDDVKYLREAIAKHIDAAADEVQLLLPDGQILKDNASCLGVALP